MLTKHPKELTRGEAVCPACSADSVWAYLDKEGTRVEVTCPNCGRIEMSRGEFDCAESDLAAAAVDPNEA